MSRAEIPVYLEIGSRRTFAGALEWPGWCRSGRDREAALQALVDYAPRYSRAVGRGAGFTKPADVGQLEVVERLPGNATTDFGAPGAVPRGDEQPLEAGDLGRQRRLLEAAWRAFDAAMQATAGTELRKGPRGGGRDHEAIARHVLEAERSYLAQLRVKYTPATDGGPMQQMPALRAAVIGALETLGRGESDDSGRGATKWTLRYFIRRAAWHVLDHAWEIEDRATPAR